MTKKTDAPKSGTSGGGETSGQSGSATGAAPGSSKMRKGNKRDLASDPDRIRKNLDRYREEMAEDAPASDTPEDNP